MVCGKLTLIVCDGQDPGHLFPNASLQCEEQTLDVTPVLNSLARHCIAAQFWNAFLASLSLMSESLLKHFLNT